MRFNQPNDPPGESFFLQVGSPDLFMVKRAKPIHLRFARRHANMPDIVQEGG